MQSLVVGTLYTLIRCRLGVATRKGPALNAVHGISAIKLRGYVNSPTTYNIAKIGHAGMRPLNKAVRYDNIVIAFVHRRFSTLSEGVLCE